MKIAILSRDGTLYSCRRLREAAQQRGHQIEILDPLSCYMNVSPVASSIHYKGRQLPHFDAVIPRIGSAITYYGTAALRQFELLGSYPLNESVAITRARDKLRSLQLLARQGIDLPLTGIAHSPDDTSDLIAMVGGAPLGHCCKVSDEAAFCLIQRPYISKTLLTRRISPRGSP